MSEDAVVVEALVQRPDATEDEGSNKKVLGDLEPSRKRARGDTGDEERKRGKRMFGSLLGTLGGFKKEASSDKAQERAARQAELAIRQKEKLKKAADDIAIKQAQEKALQEEKAREFDAVYLKSQAELKLSYDVHVAHHLSTSCPGAALLYLPWKLTEAQESQIERQVRTAKALLNDNSKPDGPDIAMSIDESGKEQGLSNGNQGDQEPAIESIQTESQMQAVADDSRMESSSTNEVAIMPAVDTAEPMTAEAPVEEAAPKEDNVVTLMDPIPNSSSGQLDTAAKLTIPSDDRISTPDINAPLPKEFEEAFDS